MKSTVKTKFYILFFSLVCVASACGVQSNSSENQIIPTVNRENNETIFSNSSTDANDKTVVALEEATSLEIREFDGTNVVISLPTRYLSTTSELYMKLVNEINTYTEMNITWDWGDKDAYYEELEQKYRSGQLADVLVVQKDDAFIQAVENGQFWDVGPYLDEFDNLSMLPEVIRLYGTVNGGMYAIPQSDAYSWGLSYRLDWLNRLELEPPTNWDSFWEMLRAFTYDDPDGNGLDDTVGLYMNNQGMAWDVLECWLGVANEWGIDANGDLIHKTRTDEYKEAYTVFRQMYAEGLINSGVNGVTEFRQVNEVSTVVQNGGYERGLGGSVLESLSSMRNVRDRWAEAGLISEDDVALGLQASVATNSGTHCLPAEYSTKTTMLAISTRRVTNVEQLKIVLQLLDNLHDPACIELIEHGWEGENYYFDDNDIIRIMPREEKDAYYNIDLQRIFISPIEKVNNKLASNENWVAGSLGPYVNRLAAANLQNYVSNYGAQFISATETAKGVELDALLQDAEFKYIAGEIDDAGFEVMLDIWWENGGEQITKELNEQYHAVYGVAEGR